MAYHIVGSLNGKPFVSKSHLTKSKADDEHKRLKKAGLKKSAVVPIRSLGEDAVPVNNAGSGAIKGIGTGPHPDSEPGVPKKRLKVILNKARMLTRKTP
jgi:hypothetical protein